MVPLKHSLNVSHAFALLLTASTMIVKNMAMKNISKSIHTTYCMLTIRCLRFQKYITVRLNAITTNPINTMTLEYKKKYIPVNELSHVPEPKGL